MAPSLGLYIRLISALVLKKKKRVGYQLFARPLPSTKDMEKL